MHHIVYDERRYHMDPQLKRGFLEVCVLASIRKQDSYGYQIVKEVPAPLDLTESTLYPLLKRLEATQCLTVYSVEYNSRLRKYYHITPVGLQKIDEFLAEENDIVSIYEYVKGGGDR
jgi:PadR family transcriptional regulator PadR